jgi:hypothetical protein
VLFRSLTSRCSIYEYRPISCRCFPYGVDPEYKVVVAKELCGEDCFKDEPQKNWKEQEESLKITWANIHGMQLFLKARISGNIDYKDKSLGKQRPERVDIELEKRNQAVRSTMGLYQDFITTFYFLYPELVNIEELTKELNKSDKSI